MKRVWDVIVVGCGPAGCTAAMYAARAGLEVLMLDKLSAGGQMALAERIDNYPGFEAGIEGFALGEKMRMGAERFGAEMRIAEVTGVAPDGPVKRVETSEGDFSCRALILAVGATHRELGLAGEHALNGKGVHYCAACDGMRYRGEAVAVVGGGNSAAMDALTLSRICARVVVVHRRDGMRAEKVYRDPLERAANVEFRWNSAVEELRAENGKLTGLGIRDLRTGAQSALSVAAAFICIGRTPETAPFRGALELDSEGWIPAGADTRTSIPGVYAAGDVRARELRQVATAVADGAEAARRAEAYLAENAR